MSAIRLHKALGRVWASEPGWRGWLTTVNHTDLGRMFLFVAALYFVIGGILAMLIRAQLASPRSAFMGPEVYAQVFTMHGTIMMFLFAIPLFEGVAVYLLPKLLGSRDLAFPRLTAYGFWCYAFGGAMLIFALLAGIAPDGGWFMYPPLTGPIYAPGINTDFWLIGITFVEISAICAAVEITVTVLRCRAPGMSLDRMPIFGWYALVTAVMILTGFPPLILGSILLELERAFGMPFFQVAEGGDSLLWQHLFWLFGHPEVYIIFLPAAGIVSTVLPVLARTTLLGYGWIVAAAVSLGVLSFGLWVHHMFTTGIPHMGLAFFSAASTLVAVPTAVQIFAWIGTLWKGRPALRLPMLWLLSFFATFVIGGLTGVMVAVVPFDWQVHDTHFIVAHLHYVLVGGFVFPMLAGLYYWLPHLTGRRRFFRIGEIAFWLVAVSFHVTFLAVHWAGLLGQRRRTFTFGPDDAWSLLNLVASIGSFVLAIGFALVILDVLVNALIAARGTRNPWGAGTLEWAMPTPPAAYNFASLPEVADRDPLWADPDLPVRIARGEGYLAGAERGRREILAVDVASGRPVQVVVLPGNTALPIAMSAATGGIFLGLLLKTYWLVPLAALVVAAMAIRWVWCLGTDADAGPQAVGHGLRLPLASDSADPPGWWGSLFLIGTSLTLFGSLLFGYAFLWTVAPNWPPPSYLHSGWASPALAGIGSLLACLGIRLAQRRLRRGRLPLVPLGAVTAGCGALVAAAVTVMAGTSHDAHAYDAVAWVLAGHAILHAGVPGLMSLVVLAAALRARLSAARSGPVHVLRLWTDHAAAVTVIGLVAIWLPGWLT
ncbi:cytochrome c oxidase subunit I [Jannaschia formosa]|uniref:cytochrome c oxidase subunit I n=1 Tax=Jannaschia formosa TaxID=2259592 RepID=UPI000E1C3099|nr:cytochrome c oxidase subunit I [Jannaschia formosa]TFL18353.1 cytochrome c oxidase subunit I [Jannaschia formosa]